MVVDRRLQGARRRRALYYSWRDKILEGGKAVLVGKTDRRAEKELQTKIRELERTLDRKTREAKSAVATLLGAAGNRRGPDDDQFHLHRPAVALV